MSKWSHSILGGILFAIFSSRFTYNLTSKGLATLTPAGKPTGLGLALHTVLFTLIVKFFMSLGINCGDSDEIETIEIEKRNNMISVYSGILFAIISSPFAKDIFKSELISTLVYILVIRISMEY